jgi:hypothetical protein
VHQLHRRGGSWGTSPRRYWIEKKAEKLAERYGKPFPDRLRWVLQHIVLSHHGQYEFGSPKLPAIPEAIAVHYLDNLDAKVTMFLAEIESDRDPVAAWTNYNKALETKVYKIDVMACAKKPEGGQRNRPVILRSEGLLACATAL